MTASQIVRRIIERRYPGLGCSDGGCVFGHQGGMHTNGGCRCLDIREPYQVKRAAMALSDVARVLASVVSDEFAAKEEPTK